MATKTLAMLALGVTLAGCVSNTEIVPVGPDSFMISATTRGGAFMGEAPIVAAKAAHQHCAPLGRSRVSRRTDSTVEGLNNIGTNTLVFSCVAETDPEYQRPNLKHDPNVLIERRG